jgi:hypothetical protein
MAEKTQSTANVSNGTSARPALKKQDSDKDFDDYFVRLSLLFFVQTLIHTDRTARPGPSLEMACLPPHPWQRNTRDGPAFALCSWLVEHDYAYIEVCA